MLKPMPGFSKSLEVFLERECIQEETDCAGLGIPVYAVLWAHLSSPVLHVPSVHLASGYQQIYLFEGMVAAVYWPLVLRLSEPSICTTADSCQTWSCSWSMVPMAAWIWSWPYITRRGPVHRLRRLPVEFSCWEALTAVLNSWLLFSSISKW